MTGARIISDTNVENNLIAIINRINLFIKKKICPTDQDKELFAFLSSRLDFEQDKQFPAVLSLLCKCYAYGFCCEVNVDRARELFARLTKLADHAGIHRLYAKSHLGYRYLNVLPGIIHAPDYHKACQLLLDSEFDMEVITTLDRIKDRKLLPAKFFSLIGKKLEIGCRGTEYKPDCEKARSYYEAGVAEKDYDSAAALASFYQKTDLKMEVQYLLLAFKFAGNRSIHEEEAILLKRFEKNQQSVFIIVALIEVMQLSKKPVQVDEYLNLLTILANRSREAKFALAKLRFEGSIIPADQQQALALLREVMASKPIKADALDRELIPFIMEITTNHRLPDDFYVSAGLYHLNRQDQDKALFCFNQSNSAEASFYLAGIYKTKKDDTTTLKYLAKVGQQVAENTLTRQGAKKELAVLEDRYPLLHRTPQAIQVAVTIIEFMHGERKANATEIAKRLEKLAKFANSTEFNAWMAAFALAKLLLRMPKHHLVNQAPHYFRIAIRDETIKQEVFLALQDYAKTNSTAACLLLETASAQDPSAREAYEANLTRIMAELDALPKLSLNQSVDKLLSLQQSLDDLGVAKDYEIVTDLRQAFARHLEQLRPLIRDYFKVLSDNLTNYFTVTGLTIENTPQDGVKYLHSLFFNVQLLETPLLALSAIRQIQTTLQEKTTDKKSRSDAAKLFYAEQLKLVNEFLAKTPPPVSYNIPAAAPRTMAVLKAQKLPVAMESLGNHVSQPAINDSVGPMYFLVPSTTPLESSAIPQAVVTAFVPIPVPPSSTPALTLAEAMRVNLSLFATSGSQSDNHLISFNVPPQENAIGFKK